MQTLHQQSGLCFSRLNFSDGSDPRGCCKHFKHLSCSNLPSRTQHSSAAATRYVIGTQRAAAAAWGQQRMLLAEVLLLRMHRRCRLHWTPKNIALRFSVPRRH
jgi:hypothetical protein